MDQAGTTGSILETITIIGIGGTITRTGGITITVITTAMTIITMAEARDLAANKSIRLEEIGAAATAIAVDAEAVAGMAADTVAGKTWLR